MQWNNWELPLTSPSTSETTSNRIVPIWVNFVFSKAFSTEEMEGINTKANASLKTKYWLSLEYVQDSGSNEQKKSLVLPDKTDGQKKGHQSGPALVCEQLEKLTLSSESEAECPESVILSDDSVWC